MKFHKGLFMALIGLAVALAAPAGADAKPKKEKAPPAPIALPTPPPGKGQIVFFRPSGMGFALGCSVNERGQKVSSLGAGKYFVMVADPGKHEFSVKSEAEDALAVEVEPDETQFVSCIIKMGVMVGRPDIRPMTEEEFRKYPKLGLVDDDDMGPGPGSLRSTDLAAALAGQQTAVVSSPAVGTEPAADNGSAAVSPEGEAAAAAEGAAAPATEGEAAPAADGSTPSAETPPGEAAPAVAPEAPDGAPEGEGIPEGEAAPTAPADAAPAASPETGTSVP